MQIFKTNEFFCGLSIPDPGTIDPIEKKLPRDIAGPEAEAPSGGAGLGGHGA